MRARAVIRLGFPSEDRSRIVFGALEPEARTAPTPRSKVLAERRGRSLVLTLEARDTSALRAAVNSYLRFVYLAVATLDAVEGL